MASPAQLLLPYAMPAMLAWMYYKRIRRNFGPQAWQPTRIWIRLAVVALATLGLATASVFVPHAALPITGSLAAGVVLGWIGLRHTHAEWRDGVRTYIPNPWIGGALTLVLAGRLAWRYMHGGMQGGIGMQGGQQPNVLTMAIAAVLVAYALTYSIGLVVRMRALGAHPPA